MRLSIPHRATLPSAIVLQLPRKVNRVLNTDATRVEKQGMIDWIAIASNSLWIAGLAVVLATVSYAYWAAGQQQSSLTQVLQQRPFLRSIYIGLMLVGLGLAATSNSTLELILGGLFTAGAAYGLFTTLRPEPET